MSRSIVSNAFWNVVTGASSAVVSLLVPPVLTHALSADGFATWALALQIGTYVNLLGFGLQTAVARYVALAEAKGDRGLRDGIVSTAFYFLAAAGAVGWLAIVGVAAGVQHLVPGIPVALLGEVKITIALIGLAAAFGLVTTVFAAVFTGLRRSHVPAQILGGGRLILAAGLVATAQVSHSIAVLAAVYLAVNIGMALALAWAWHAKTPGPRLALSAVSRRVARELAGFCFSLTVWTFAMLLINGLDLVIVGRFAFAQTAYFAVSATLVTFVAGTLNSISNALIPVSAGLAAQSDGVALEKLLERGSRMVTGASLLVAAPLIFTPSTILHLWLGPVYAEHAGRILRMLAIAGVIRTSILPYVVIAIGVGVQRRMLVTPVVEGAICILGSLLLVQRFGAIGIAYAKIVGATFAIGLLLAQNAIGRVLKDFKIQQYLCTSIVRPALAWVAIAVFAFCLDRLGLSAFASLLLLVLGTAAAAGIIIFSREDRQQAMALSPLARSSRS